MIKPLTFCLLFLCSGLAVADKNTPANYICFTKASGGVTYNENSKSWRGAEFSVKMKYFVMVDHSRPDNVARVFENGNDFPSYHCSAEDSSDNFYSCEGFGGEFVFNQRTLRFFSSSLVGYLGGGNSGDSPLKIIVGTCSLL